MSERYREIMATLSDPGRYVRAPGRAIFDEHDEEYFVDKDGRACAPDAPGAVRKVRRFGKRQLEAIAARCNARDRTGTLAPLTFGHTVPTVDGKGRPLPVTERDQPEPRGYATNYTVGHDASLGRHVIRADFYVRRRDHDEARTYPRVSIELWPRQGVIDPIALLRRTPRRDLGQWTYAAGHGPVLRYSMEGAMGEEHDLPELPDLPDGPGETPGDGGGEAAHERYMKACYGHPDFEAAHAYAKSKYGMADAAPPGGAPKAPPDAPVGMEEAPERNAAFAAPSATNAVAPAKGVVPGGEPKRNAAQEEVLRYQAEVQSLRAEVARARAEVVVGKLAADGYLLDEADEVDRFAALGEVDRKAREAYIRRNVTRAPINGPLLAPAPAQPVQGAPVDLENNPEAMPAKDVETALAYQRRHELWDLDLAALAARSMPARYGRGEPKRGA